MLEQLRNFYLFMRNKILRAPTDEELNAAAEDLLKLEDLKDIDPSRNTFSASRGMCLIVFPGGRPDYCRNDMTNTACQLLAHKHGGHARPVIPGSRRPI